MHPLGIITAFCLVMAALFAPIAYSQTYTTRDDIPADAPFKRASPELLVPAPPPGPRSTTSAPVEAVDSGDAPEVQAVESQDLAPPEADEVKTVTSSGTVYADDEDADSRIAVLRCLNKVTAKFEEMKVKVGSEVHFGRLTIAPVACRSATAESQPEHAALLTIREQKDAAGRPQAPAATPTEENEIFSGWVLASSPSLNGLEHPVYDISLVGCQSPKKPKS